jgi:hypothetical protein
VLKHLRCVPVLLILVQTAALAATPPTAPPVTDSRALVDMPPAARALMRQDMLDHLSALNSLIASLAQGDMAAVAETAESQLGLSSMGKHSASGNPPGRFMPTPMRSIGRSMHEAASELAVAAKQGDSKATLTALSKVTQGCVACHLSYRTH